ncbi:MAG: hypothetical protein LBF56_00965 [Holosporales bacterium]|jgi:hypothetical protein|nr:hypothetical protein [Holosporales bacterium]
MLYTKQIYSPAVNSDKDNPQLRYVGNKNLHKQQARTRICVVWHRYVQQAAIITKDCSKMGSEAEGDYIIDSCPKGSQQPGIWYDGKNDAPSCGSSVSFDVTNSSSSSANSSSSSSSSAITYSQAAQQSIISNSGQSSFILPANSSSSKPTYVQIVRRGLPPGNKNNIDSSSSGSQKKYKGKQR